ncbi:MAG: gamma carbonic anhydrase family protein [Acidobacteriia bacterium]|nr:gamma carbonic anhydrase family protein [Terriglobia bacterium]
MILEYQGVQPKIAAGVYIAPSADIIGDVEIGEDSSVWFQCVLRGDVHYIRIGARSNIQDGSVLHVHRGQFPLVIGNDVTVGHTVTLHGCTIESKCLIGMGCTILNNVKVGSGSIIAAGALVTEGTVVPPRSLFMGVPAKFVRHLNESDEQEILRYARNYVEYRAEYLKAQGAQAISS